jgi:hypothetical protein
MNLNYLKQLTMVLSITEDVKADEKTFYEALD